MNAARHRELGAMYLAIADVQERLAEAKRVHDRERTPESRAAKRVAMQAMAEFRVFFRSVTRIKELQAALLKLAAEDPQREAVEAEIAGLYEQVGLPQGSLPAEMRELPAGSARAYTRPARGRAGKVG